MNSSAFEQKESIRSQYEQAAVSANDSVTIV